MKKFKIIFGVLGVILIIGIATILFLRHLAVKSLPDYNQDVTLSGLKNKVEIYRDEFAVPHVYAKNQYDLFFAQGFLHAQDRFFQMDLYRRIGEGRLSEIVGTKTLKFDSLFRTIGMKEIAIKLENQISQTSHEILNAYTDGVNAYIIEQKGKYPVEFDILDYYPEKWKPYQSLMISRLMAWELNTSWMSDLALGEIALRFGEEKASEIYPTYPENDPLIIPTELKGKSISFYENNLMKNEFDFREAFGFSGTHVGSNAWVVSAKKSATGSTMLANDPHLMLSQPAKWYEIHLVGGDYDIAGMSLPGVPTIVIGQNKNIAWGVTNIMADDADFYLLKTDSLDQNKYLYQNSTRDFSIKYDTIKVKDSASIVLKIRNSHFGPIINDVHNVDGKIKEFAIAMRWTGQEMSDELLGIANINRANNWNEFLNGVKYFSVPGQNFVYADKNGNIGYSPGVRLPIRKNQNPTLPFPGWTNEFEWKGFVPFEELPKYFNPTEGFIATANNKTIENFPYHISNLWESGSRSARLREVLKSNEKITVNDMKNLQFDNFSHFAKKFIPYIVKAFDSVEVKDEKLRTAVTYFRNWDYHIKKDDVTSALYAVTLNHVLKNIFEDEMGDKLLKNYVFLSNIPYRVLPTLFEKGTSLWFDDIRTPQVETLNEMLRKSVSDAIIELDNSLGGDIKTWQWGKIHKLTFKHLFGDTKPIDVLFNVGPFEMNGDATTLNKAEYRLDSVYSVNVGPSNRRIVNFADIDASESVIPTGQSGQIFSKHYDDQNILWLNGQYHPMPITKKRIETIAKYKNQLIPKEK